MKIVVIDGQGGKMGSLIVRRLKETKPDREIYAVGTNSIATTAMLKAGADFGATGENPVVRNVRDADIIVGPVGILVADAILGEVTPAMAVAVGSSSATKILIPVSSCNVYVAGTEELPLGAYIAEAAAKADALCRE